MAALAASGQPVVLVHGTSAAADALAQKAGVAVRQLTSPSGHVSRYTDPETLEITSRSRRAGQQRLVAMLQGLGCNAVGLSGVDGRLLVAERKEAVRSVEAGHQRIVRDDYTGSWSPLTPVAAAAFRRGYARRCPTGTGQSGSASQRRWRPGRAVAAFLGATTLVILSNVPGLLAGFPTKPAWFATCRRPRGLG